MNSSPFEEFRSKINDLNNILNNQTAIINLYSSQISTDDTYFRQLAKNTIISLFSLKPFMTMAEVKEAFRSIFRVEIGMNTIVN